MSAVVNEIGRRIGSVWVELTEGEIAAGLSDSDIVAPNFEPGDARRYGYVADGLDDDTDTGTDNATALENCINSNFVTDLPDGVGMFSGSISLPRGRTIRGKGPRATTLRQMSTATVSGIILGDVVSSDISEGAHRVVDLCLKVAAHASAHGIQIGDGATTINASMLDFSNLRIWSQQQENHTSAPYTAISGQRGIYVNNNSAGSIFFANTRNLELRAFDVAIDSAGSPVSANEWRVHGWALDCRIAVRLSNASTWDLSGLTVESGVANARALYCLDDVSNLTWNGGRWELTQANSYGVEGDVTWAGQNIRISGVTILIDGDGGAIPGRKWTGTLPDDFVFYGYDVTPEPFVVIPNFDINLRLPNLVELGGSGVGSGRIRIDRNAGGAPGDVGVDANGHLYILPTNHPIRGAQTSAIPDGHLANSQLSYYLNEAGNTLVFKVKYSTGTVKTGTVALT